MHSIVHPWHSNIVSSFKFWIECIDRHFILSMLTVMAFNPLFTPCVQRTSGINNVAYHIYIKQTCIQQKMEK